MTDGRDPVPVTVIGGYLGAGKTTLINALLRQANGRRLAVMVNDFGELPIDVDLIEGQDGDVLTLAGGCVCCSYGSDLMDALAALALRIPPPNHVLVETSGVALPGAVAGAVTLRADYRLDGIIGLVSAATALDTIGDRYLADTVERQVREAQLLLLNHVDQALPVQIEQLRGWLDITAPGVPIIPTTFADVPLELVIGSDAQRGATLSLGGPLPDRFQAVAFDLPAAVDVAELCQRLSDPALGFLRVKAVVRDVTGTGWVVQAIGREVTQTVRDRPILQPRLRAIALRNRIGDAAVLGFAQEFSVGRTG